MKIFKYKEQGGIDHNESQLTRLSASVSNGDATITRRIYFEAENPDEDAIDILSLPEFPQKYAVHPRHAGFKYYGNAQIEPLSDGSKYWKAELEYTSQDPNATDADGGAITSETPPWKLKPDNIQFSYPEVVVPFEMSYDELGKNTTEKKDKAILPVQNSAGDPIPMERSERFIQVGFTFATKKWDANYNLEYGNTINAEDIEVCGLKIPKFGGLLLPPECSYITVYKDNSSVVKWQYWSVTINLQIDVSGMVLYRTKLDTGDRAKGKTLSLGSDHLLQAAKGYDPGLVLALTEHSNASQICHFRLTTGQDSTGGKKIFVPTGSLIFCTWQQYLEARQLYLNASQILIEKKVLEEPYELTCEQDTQMPLEGGYLQTKAIPGHSDYVEGTKYNIKRFREHPVKSWKSLNLPKKGIK